MDVETVFRGTFGIKKEHDIVELIEAAVSVAGLIVPGKLKKHRSRIVKLLFDEDHPPNSMFDLFSDDDLGSEDVEKDKLSDPVKVAVSNQEIGFKKAVELCVEVPPTPSISEKIVGLQDKSMELKLEAAKKMLGHKYHEEEEKKKAKRKIESMDVDFPKPKKHCGYGGSKVKKAPGGGDVRQRIVSRMKRMKAENEEICLSHQLMKN